jgi:hypothetical protein
MVEQDLERIRRASLPPDQMEAIELREAKEREEFVKDRHGIKDLFAMSVAVLSLVAPYVLVFAGLIIAFGLIFNALV